MDPALYRQEASMMLAVNQSTGSLPSLASFAPSDASNQLAFEELTSISQMIESKTKELHIREQNLLKYRSKLNSEVLQAQKMLETLALALYEEAEAKIVAKTEILVKRVSNALDSADFKVSAKRQSKEQIAFLENKILQL